MDDIELLKRSCYFDPDFYSQRYPDTAGTDPLKHYLEHGGLKGLWPSQFFDPIAYWTAYPDVQAAQIIPLVHFLRDGLLARRWAGVVPTVPAWSELPRPTPDELDSIAIVAASPLFDPTWYRENHPFLSDVSAAAHYVSVGASLGSSPGPGFSGRAYSLIHSDIGSMNPLLHYECHGRQEGRALGMPAEVADLVRQELAHLAQFEPDLTTDSRLFDGLDTLPYVSSMPRSAAVACWNRIWSEIGPEVTHLVFVPWLVRGGADLAAVNIVKALQHQAGITAVAMVATDHTNAQAVSWLPAGTKFVQMSNQDCIVTPAERKVLVERLIWTLRPQSIYNVNSRACWDATAQTGRALSHMTQLNALLFCRDYTADGRAAGYSDTHFRASLPYMNHVFLDTHYFMKELCEQYGLPDELKAKLRYLPQPYIPPIAPYQRTQVADRPKFLWAGRFATQKNINLLAAIMSESTGFDFDIWGSGDPEIEARLRQIAQELPYVRLCGSFASLEELPLNSYAALLFTSLYEGMPTIILNIAATGMPIVATAVGGVREVVDDETGWPIAERDCAKPYIDALTQILSNPTLVSRKCAAMSLLLSKRSQQYFEKGLFQ